MTVLRDTLCANFLPALIFSLRFRILRLFSHDCMDVRHWYGWVFSNSSVQLIFKGKKQTCFKCCRKLWEIEVSLVPSSWLSEEGPQIHAGCDHFAFQIVAIPRAFLTVLSLFPSWMWVNVEWWRKEKKALMTSRYPALRWIYRWQQCKMRLLNTEPHLQSRLPVATACGTGS